MSNRGCVVLDCNLTKPYNLSSGTDHSAGVYKRSAVVRPVAPFALHDVCIKHNIPSTVVNYVDRWEPEELVKHLATWCTIHSLDSIIVACSAQFTSDVIATNEVFKNTILLLKAKYDVTLVLGGPIASPQSHNWGDVKPDVVFQGRSLHLFEAWLIGEAPERYRSVVNGIVNFKNFSGAVVEEPLVPNMYDDYCLHENDVVQFEVRLGCKFNCTFCNFEFRNAKITTTAEEEQLYTMFRDANSKYGVTRFGLVDDTFNEDDEKIDLLLSAVERLSFKPKIIGYTRFDVMMRRPWQAPKLDKIGFWCHFFGIETLHPEAGRLIKKNVPRAEALDYLQHLNDEYPHWFMSSGYILGLPGEPMKHSRDVLKEIRQRQLLQAVTTSALILFQISGWNENESDMVKDPERFGITVQGRKEEGEVFSGIHFLSWRHAHSSSEEANKLRLRVNEQNGKAGITNIGPWEVISRDAIGEYNLFDVEQRREYTNAIKDDYTMMYSPTWKELERQFYVNYVERKKQYFTDLYQSFLSV